MKRVEIVLISIAVLAIFWKALDYPFGNMVTMLSLLGLSCLYFYFSFVLLNSVPLRKMFKKDAYAEASSIRIIGTICTGVLLSITVLGILFQVMSWPFSKTNLLLGFLGLLIISVIRIIKYFKQKEGFYKKILLRSIIYCTIALVLLYIIPPYTFLKIKYKDHPDYIEVLKQLDKDPNNQELQKQEQELYNKITTHDRTGKR
ncbi:hypothetical protein [Aquimarina sp. MMG016]|uniref:hypothetical protein n=1 Tax=Aquimarina sp. MMG016 TaxID=2822690 RepID=UPI001B3A6C47|nr:hypothetical protein [Aquimarina sp. MMG016]MBQ4821149.1 hypothetical protein [Aquimarina sp. MMG016]